MTKNCLKCNKVFIKPKNNSLAYWNIRRFCSKRCGKLDEKLSEETKQRMSRTQKLIGNKPPILFGKEHPLWKGGESTRQERNHIYYKKWYTKLKNKKYLSEYQNRKKKYDLQFRIACNLRSRLWQAIKNVQKKGSAIRDLGCSISELKVSFEKQFKPGMTWENYGEWHIDHVKPLSVFDLSDRKELLKAVHYTNLQPLWARENISKRNKIIV